MYNYVTSDIELELTRDRLRPFDFVCSILFVRFRLFDFVHSIDFVRSILFVRFCLLIFFHYAVNFVRHANYSNVLLPVKKYPLNIVT